MGNKYKKSVFNIIVDELSAGDILIFNSFRSTFGIMDCETQCMYENIESFDIAANDNEKVKETFSVLYKNGFIVPMELDEHSLIELEYQRAKFDNTRFALTIAPTLACNMSCPYCFEEHRAGRMNDTVQEALCIFVEKHIEDTNCKAIHVTWYGGEPLLEVDIISSLSHRIMSICETHNVIYTASIITNGVLLSRKVAEKLVALKILRAQITIDGMPKYHNSRRVLKNGEESFDVIMNNIDACYDLMDINVRVNVDEGNIENIEELISFLINEKGWKKNPSFYLAPVENYTDADYFNQTKKADLLRFIDYDESLMERTCDMIDNKPNPSLYPRRKSAFCQAASLNSYVVDSEGYLYKCWNVIGNKEKAVGTVVSNDRMNIEGIKWLSYKPGEECYSCSYLPLCLGGCPYQYIEKGKHSCGTVKETALTHLRLAYRQYISLKDRK